MRHMVAVLLTPFVFAYLLKPVGIYFSAPFFICRNHLVVWRTQMEGDFDHDAVHLLRIHRVVFDDFERPIAPRECVTLL